MKKSIIGLLAAIFTFGLVLNVNAEAITTDSSKKGTVDTNSALVTNQAAINITNAPTTDVLVAYKILDTFYNASTNVFTYEFTSDFKAFLATTKDYKNLTVEQYYALTSGDTTSGSTRTQSTLDKLVSLYAAYVKTHSVTTSATLTYQAGEGATGAVVPAGAYLVIPKSTINVYAVMVGNVIPTANGSEWVINDATIKAKISSASVTKSIGSIGHVDGNYSVSEEFSYFLVGTVPQYPTNATNKTYTITDTVGAGITLSNIGSIVVKDGATTLTNSNGVIKNAGGDTVATITITGQKITIVFDANYVQSTTVTVEYKAKLNNNATVGSAGNLNSATLTYSNDPYGTGTNTTSAVNASAFTYGIEVLIYADKDHSIVLSGVKFEIYSDPDLANKIGEIITDSNGKALLPGVAEGTYYLKQVSTAPGYNLPRDAVQVKVKIEGSVEGTDEGYYIAEVSAFEAGTLPFTGSIGTILYTMIGLVTVVSAILLFVLYNRKKEQEQA